MNRKLSPSPPPPRFRDKNIIIICENTNGYA